MYLTKTIKLPLYDTTVQFLVVKSAKKTVNRLYKKYNTGMVYRDTIAGFMMNVSINKYYIIIDENHLTYNTILHELMHLSNAITCDRSVYEEEPKCWLHGQLGQEIFDYLKFKKVNIG